MTPPEPTAAAKAYAAGDEFTFKGVTYMILYEQFPGLWMICDKHAVSGTPILRDSKWIAAALAPAEGSWR